MLPLILRLSQLDADAAGALRVVSFFDTLVAARASLDAVVRSTAGLAECPAGLHDETTGRLVRHGHREATSASSAGPAVRPPRSAVAEQEVRLGDQRVGVVWLERDGEPGRLDAIVLERMAFAVGALWPGAGPVTLSDPALVELAVSSAVPDADRSRALRLLGFPAGAPVRVLAVRSDDVRSAGEDVVRMIGAVTGRGRPARSAPIGPEAAVLTTAGSESLPALGLPAGTRIGCGTGTADLAESWRQARVAVRFAEVLGRGPVVRYGDLGSVALLAALPRDVVEADPDVTLLRSWTATPAGRRDLEVVQAYLGAGSQRLAAAALSRHHSSVSRRLDSLTARWGIDLERPADRMRAETALTLLAIADG